MGLGSQVYTRRKANLSAGGGCHDDFQGWQNDADHAIRLWNADTGELIKTVDPHRAGVFSLAISKDGKYALSGSADGTIRLWKLDIGGTSSASSGSQQVEWKPATYKVEIDPPFATLTVKDDQGVVTGSGKLRQVQIDHFPTSGYVRLEAVCSGYKSSDQWLTPTSGRAADLQIRLEKLPERETEPETETKRPATSPTPPPATTEHQVWEVHVKGQAPVTVNLYANGRVNNDPKCTWMKRGKFVTVRWPGGAVYTMMLAPNGRSATGKNQSGARITAKFIETVH